MDTTASRQVDKIIKQGWYRKSDTLGTGGWAKVHASEIDWKTYVLYAESDGNGIFHEIETIVAEDDKIALDAFSGLYHLHIFDYWEIQERITEYRLVGMKAEE